MTKRLPAIRYSLRLFVLIAAIAASLAHAQAPVGPVPPGVKATRLPDGVWRFDHQPSGSYTAFWQQLLDLFKLKPAAQPAFGRSVAFLAGVSHYDYQSPQLPYVANDLTGLRNFLLTDGGFDTVFEARDGVVSNALITSYLLNKFSSDSDLLRKDDRLLFYYSGHGGDLNKRIGFLEFSHSVPGDFSGNDVLEVDQFVQWAKTIVAKHLLIFLDACASGLAVDPKKTETPSERMQKQVNALQGTGSGYLITAGTGDQKAYQLRVSSQEGYSVLTHDFLSALRQGADESAFMSLEEAFGKAKDEVAGFAGENELKMEPKLWPISRQDGEMGGTFVFLNVNAKNPTPLPAAAGIVAAKGGNELPAETSNQAEQRKQLESMLKNGVDLAKADFDQAEVAYNSNRSLADEDALTSAHDNLLKAELDLCSVEFVPGCRVDISKREFGLAQAMTNQAKTDLASNAISQQVERRFEMHSNSLNAGYLRETMSNGDSTSVSAQPTGTSTQQVQGNAGVSANSASAKDAMKGSAPLAPASAPSLSSAAESEYAQGRALFDQKNYSGAAAILERACNEGSIKGCTDLGFLYAYGDGVAKDPAKAVSLYRRGCDGGNSVGCRHLGYLYDTGNGVAKDAAQAATLYRKACDGGDADGCRNLGLLYENGNGIAKDAVQAATLYRKACDGGDADGCRNLGLLYENGNGIAKDAVQAATLYRKACDGGVVVGCTGLGYLYDTGNGIAKNAVQAATLYRKACDGGDVAGCRNLALLYENGNGVARDAAQAATLLRKACDGEEFTGCTNLGYLYDTGNGVAKDAAQAATLYRKACDGGDVAGCRNLGLLYENGNGVAKDAVQAANLLRKACNGGEFMGCTNLGYLYDTGNGIAKDAAQAATLYRKACDGGEPNGCQNLGIDYETGDGVTKDLVQARVFYQKGCAGNDSQSCDAVKRLSN